MSRNPSHVSARKRRSILAGGVGAALVATAFPLLPLAPAQAADVPAPAGTEAIQILGINDFHGRIQNDPFSASAGAAVLAGAVKQLRTANPNTVFAAGGDLIGASTFESFIQHDKPTIDALNAAGLDVSAVGNHELDAGYADLTDRVLGAYDATTNPEGGAEWKYISANLKLKATGDPAVPATWVKTLAGVDIGFVGATTEDLPALVSPSGIADLRVDPIVSSVNAAAADLKNAGADLVVMLVHEGAPSTDCATMANPATGWGKVVTGVSADVNAIISGHTHLAYDCEFPVAGWAGRAVTNRPVVSAGQYGTNLNRLVFHVDPATGENKAQSHEVLQLKSCADSDACTNYPADAAVESAVSDAVATSEELGKEPLGKLAAGFNRAKLAGGVTDNRGGESTLGNLVAEAQRWATAAPESGSAKIAFMNPGGLRADMVGGIAGETAYPKTLTYKQAAVVQPFANTLVNLSLTGASIKKVLEQQWQRDSAGGVPNRPFLRLGVSQGFTYTFDEALPEGSRITGMWLDGAAIESLTTYSVTVNSFLASGGDNFRAFNEATSKADTGKIDLSAMVDFMAAKAGSSPLAMDASQRAVGVTFPGDAPVAYQVGEAISFAVSSWSMSAPGDLTDSEVTVGEGASVWGSAPMDNTVSDQPFDRTGAATVSVKVPAGTAPGKHVLTLKGATTGTSIVVPIKVGGAQPTLVVKAPSVSYGRPTTVRIALPADATGTVTVTSTNGKTTYGTAALQSGKASVTLKARLLRIGTTPLKVAYSGDASYAERTVTTPVRVSKAKASLTAKVSPKKVRAGKTRAAVRITVVTDSGIRATGSVRVKAPDQKARAVKLRKGSAKVKLGEFSSSGTKRVTVRYGGTSIVGGNTEVIRLRVRR